MCKLTIRRGGATSRFLIGFGLATLEVWWLQMEAATETMCCKATNESNLVSRFAGDVLMQYCGRYHSCQENILIYLRSRVRDWSLFESWSLSAYQLVEPRPSYGSRLGPKIVWSMIEWTCLLWGSQLLVFRGSCWFYYWQQHRFCRMQRGYCFHSMPVSSGSFEVFHVGENTSNQHKCSPTPSLLVKYHEISALFHRRNDFDWLHHRKLIDYLHASLALSLSLLSLYNYD